MVTNINDRTVAHITCGGDFNIAQDSDGLIWGWGKSDMGQVRKMDVLGGGAQGDKIYCRYYISAKY